MFKVKKIMDKPVYYSTLLDVEHFFTSRELEVKENKKEIADYLKIDIENLIKPTQTHSDNVEVVDINKKEYDECDSLIIDRADCAIYLNFADCTPVILYDTKNNVGAICHCGWRGTAKRIAPKTFLKMQKLYQTKPADTVAIIGPCISFSCFETYDEALNQLKNSVKNPNGLFKDNYADLKNINKRQLEELGIEKFDICPYCTVCDNDKFFSYRKENGTKKRHSAVLKIK